MKRLMTTLIAMACLCSLPQAGQAQAVAERQAIATSDVLSQISMFNYREGPRSRIAFRGTPLAGRAQGKGQVRYQNGNASIDISVTDMPDPASLGPYTTYVLWALTPDGRAINQGVVARYGDTKGSLDTRYSASQFALVITAEPHFAVTVPSTMIVLYNVADDVKGQETKVTTLTERADYATLAPIVIDKDKPLEIVQAEYSVAIAEAAGAARYAPDAFASARQKLTAAETGLEGRRSDRKMAPDSAREAVLAGEDARRAALVGSAAAAAEAERQAAAAAAAEAERRQGRAAAAAAAAAAAEAEQAAARRDLRERLNAALPTRETDRGLVSEIGGVQFATGAAELSVTARENLARFAGIVASYPDLDFSIEGHTDSTGSLALNNELSLKRASSVRDYLLSQGVPSSRIDVVGFGPSQPIASNQTNDGRARNRRVEIVISGGPLGDD